MKMKIHGLLLVSEFYFGQTKGHRANRTKFGTYSDLNDSNDVSTSIKRCTVLEITSKQNMELGCVRRERKKFFSKDRYTVLRTVKMATSKHRYTVLRTVKTSFFLID